MAKRKNFKNFFDLIDSKPDFPKMEDGLILFWKNKKIFEKSIEKNPPNKTWTFLDGPPFITGLPHYGSLLSSIPKDLFPRFWTMKGYRVRRVWGWDCHGLPAENKVENNLGIKRKKDIEEVVGVGKFIEECKKYVADVSSEWGWYIDHVGRWVDFENAYKTMNRDYMESVMWVFKQMYDKGYIYKGIRVSLYCPHCVTPISNFEVAMDPDNYKEITEESNVYKYKLVDEDVYLLAWSTTPWNKLATPALAVNSKLDYVLVKQGLERYILAKNTLKILKKNEEYEIEKEFKGGELIGRRFVPHYQFFEIEDGKRAFEVINGDFVTDDDGTGIVTIAAYGEDDLKVMQENNIQVVLHVDDEGMISKDSPVAAGKFYLSANKLVNEDLKKRGLVYKEEMYTHTIPTCWRCHERLIFAPQNAWYVDIQKLKPNLKKNNENVNWYPQHFKYGRFLKSMQAAPDWCISRSRYWGSPVPVWECDCGQRHVFGSIEELEKASKTQIKDLHKPEIDDITIRCSNCGRPIKRVPEVLDSWIEAGSASFAERHFPFDKSHKLEDFFPPDFIIEYTGQIRAWFYVLHVISTAIFDSNAFKNVLVTGVILGTDGRKMSKNFGNYPDPKETLQKYGGDALRLYLMSTPVMKAEDIAISEEQYKNEIKNYLLILWNVYNFFVTYANLDNWTPNQSADKYEPQIPNVLDQWIVGRLKQVIFESTTALEKYDTVSYAETIKGFVTDLSTWYLRRSRERRSGDFYYTMYFVLVNFCKVSAPITPFISDLIYKNLTKAESVHLAVWPKIEKLTAADKELIVEMQKVRQIVEIGHALRREAKIAVKQPLKTIKVKNPKPTIKSNFLTSEFEKLILDELNIKAIQWQAKNNLLDTNITPELEEEAKVRELVRKIQDERKKLGAPLKAKINLTYEWLPDDPSLKEFVFKKTLVNKAKRGKFDVSLVR